MQVSFETVQILVRLLASLRSWGEERPVHFTLAGPLVVLNEARKPPVNRMVYLILLVSRRMTPQPPSLKSKSAGPTRSKAPSGVDEGATGVHSTAPKPSGPLEPSEHLGTLEPSEAASPVDRGVVARVAADAKLLKRLESACRLFSFEVPSCCYPPTLSSSITSLFARPPSRAAIIPLTPTAPSPHTAR